MLVKCQIVQFGKKFKENINCKPHGHFGMIENKTRNLLEEPSSYFLSLPLACIDYLSSEFRAGLHKVGSFDTIESFWKLYLYLKRPSALESNVNLYLFRDAPDIAPMWECFPKGGCWILKIKKKRDSGASVLGKMWQDMVFSAIGECFEEPDVVGISVHIRSREDLISVWNRDNTNEDIRFHIGEKMKQILDLDPATMIEYKHNATSMQDMSSFRNAKGLVFLFLARVGLLLTLS
jgi:translation initiation factor 4E